MRKIEFKNNVNGLTKIYADGVEMDTHLDPKAMKAFRDNKSKLPPVYGQQILDEIIKRLRDDKVGLARDEIDIVVEYAKDQLSI